MAWRMLKDEGYSTLLVSPRVKEIEGQKVFASLAEAEVQSQTPHTITMYVGPEISSKLTTEILSLKPKRVIFNPGSENPSLAKQLMESGIEVLEACTLVLLRTKQF